MLLFQVWLASCQQGKVVVEIDLKEFDSHGKDWKIMINVPLKI